MYVNNRVSISLSFAKEWMEALNPQIKSLIFELKNINVVVNFFENQPAPEINVIFCFCSPNNPGTIGYCEVIDSTHYGA